MSRKFAVLLSGCGVYDGAEINEVVLTLLALEKNNISYQCFAPDIEQHHVINHLSGEVTGEKRNVLAEAARITRGNVKDLSCCITDEFDALVVPGGFGVAKTLSSFAFEGESFQINSDVLALLNRFRLAEKPAGYICIAPVLLPLVYGPGVILTIGNDATTIAVVEKLGAVHHKAAVDEIVVDETNQVVTTPAYMLAGSISEAQQGIDKLVARLSEMS
ncbi:MAG: Glyoxalase ElbB [Candidatus Erwinia impunctatus]|nr:Glyoxalase ElbB [Culicoides impunctatus]